MGRSGNGTTAAAAVALASALLTAGSLAQAQEDNVFARTPLQNALVQIEEERKWRMLAEKHFGTSMLTYEQELVVLSLHFRVPYSLLQAIAEQEPTDKAALRTVRRVAEHLAKPLREGMRASDALAAVTTYPPEVVQRLIARGNELQRATIIELRREPNGHFFARTAVNGAAIRMVIDTGATSVFLAPADAAAAGIRVGAAGYATPIQTATGVTHVAEVTLDHLVVEGRSLGPVSAFVLPSGNESLLGVSALRRLGRIELDGDLLRIEAARTVRSD